MNLILSALLISSSVVALPAKRATLATVYESCVKSNQIAMTFDDGAYQWLRNISDQFTAANAKATFFFNGNNWDCIYKDTHISDVKYAYAAGHMIAAHTWSHGDLQTFNEAQIVDTMYRTEEALSRIIGIKPAFIRPPYGSYNSLARQVAASRGQSIAMWDQDTKDSDGATVAQSKNVYKAIADNNLKNAVVLQHETKEGTVGQVVPYAIQLLKSKGYQLVTLAECLGVDPYQAVGVPQVQDPTWTCDGTPGPGQPCKTTVAGDCKTGFPLFIPSGTTPPTGPTTTTKTNQFIHPSAGSSKCLTVTSNANGAPVTISDCLSSTSTQIASQQWTTILGTSSNTGLLQIYGDKCLDVPSGNTADGTKLQIWTCNPATNPTPNQQWNVVGNTIKWDGKGKCLDNKAGGLTNGNPSQIWTCNGNINQQWGFTTGTTVTPPPATTGKTIRPNASATTCLTAVNNADGAPITIQPCDGSTGQAWTQNGNTFRLYGNKCLDVTDGNTANGAKLQIWTCANNSANQSFTVNTSTKQITWTGKGQCVDLSGGSLTAGTRTQMWKCATGNNNQVWNIV